MTESRVWTTEYGPATVRAGRSVVGIRRPFCEVVIEAYVWSLAGSGKRCECGAVHTWLGQVSLR